VAGDLLDLRKQVAREKHGYSMLGRKSAYQIANLVSTGWVQPIGGLVENEEIRLREQGQRDAQPLAHSLGVCLDEAVGVALQPDDSQHALNVGSIKSHKSLRDLQVLVGGQVRVQRWRLDHCADSAHQNAPIYASELLAKNANFASIRAGETKQHTNGRRLSCAVGAEERIDAAARDPQVQVVYREHILKLPCQSSGLDGKIGHQCTPVLCTKFFIPQSASHSWASI
jgi:hypothetical protein